MAGPSDEPPGWFRDEPLSEIAAAATIAAPTSTGMAVTPTEPDAIAGSGPVHADADVVADAAEGADDDDLAPASTPGTIYRTVPPLPEDAVARPRRRSPIVSVLVGLLILVVVGAGGFVIGMVLPLLIPLPAGETSVVSPGPSGAAPSATPGASAITSSSPAPAVSPSPRASASPSPAATPRIYVVKRGDQLGRIAASFGVTLQALQAANNIANPNLIFAGQKLVIPAPAASAAGSPGASPSAAP